MMFVMAVLLRSSVQKGDRAMTLEVNRDAAAGLEETEGWFARNRGAIVATGSSIS